MHEALSTKALRFKALCRTFRFPGAELDAQSCEIVYDAIDIAGFYAVAIMVEDFSPEDLTTALSSVGLQVQS